jgi:GNAT superfamily N-acetyltransferase
MPVLRKDVPDLREGAATTIRLGTAADVERCIAIEIAAAHRFAAIGMGELVAITESDPYMRAHGAGHAADGSLIVAEQDGRVAGYAALKLVDGLAHLCEIDANPTYAGRGLGRALIEACIAWAKAPARACRDPHHLHRRALERSLVRPPGFWTVPAC